MDTNEKVELMKEMFGTSGIMLLGSVGTFAAGVITAGIIIYDLAAGEFQKVKTLD